MVEKAMAMVANGDIIFFGLCILVFVILIMALRRLFRSSKRKGDGAGESASVQIPAVGSGGNQKKPPSRPASWNSRMVSVNQIFEYLSDKDAVQEFLTALQNEVTFARANEQEIQSEFDKRLHQARERTGSAIERFERCKTLLTVLTEADETARQQSAAQEPDKPDETATQQSAAQEPDKNNPSGRQGGKDAPHFD